MEVMGNGEQVRGRHLLLSTWYDGTVFGFSFPFTSSSRDRDCTVYASEAGGPRGISLRQMTTGTDDYPLTFPSRYFPGPFHILFLPTRVPSENAEKTCGEPDLEVEAECLRP